MSLTSGQKRREGDETDLREIIRREVERTVRKLSALWTGLLDVLGEVPIRIVEEGSAPGWTDGRAIYLSTSNLLKIIYPYTGRYRYNPILEGLKHLRMIRELEETGEVRTSPPSEEYYKDITMLASTFGGSGTYLAGGSSPELIRDIICSYYPNICENIRNLVKPSSGSGWFHILVLGSIPAVLIHELLHVLYNHPERFTSLIEHLEENYGSLAGKVGQYVANRAADVIVNADALPALYMVSKLGDVMSPEHFLEVLVPYIASIAVCFPYMFNAAYNFANRILSSQDLRTLLPIAERIAVKSGLGELYSEEPTVEGKLLIALTALLSGLALRDIYRQHARRLGELVTQPSRLIRELSDLVRNSIVARLGVEPVTKRIVLAVVKLYNRAGETARRLLEAILESREAIHVTSCGKGRQMRGAVSRSMPQGGTSRGASRLGLGLYTREAERGEQARLNWRRLLSSILSAYMGYGYQRSTYARPSIVPGLPGTYSLRGELWTLLDVSESINDKELGIFLAELERILRTLPDVDKLNIVEWSSEAVGPIRVRSPSELRRISIETTGSTVISPALRLVLKHGRSSRGGIIVFTDSIITDLEEPETVRLLREVSNLFNPRIWVTIAEEPPEHVRRLGWRVIYYTG